MAGGLSAAEVDEFADAWRRDESRRREANRIGRAIDRARTPATVYRLARRRRAVRLAEAVRQGEGQAEVLAEALDARGWLD